MRPYEKKKGKTIMCEDAILMLILKTTRTDKSNNLWISTQISKPHDELQRSNKHFKCQGTSAYTQHGFISIITLKYSSYTSSLRV